jgi:hypothetical protein
MNSLFQKWLHKNEFIHISNMKISKNHSIKSATFQIFFNKATQKLLIFYLQSNLKGILNI